MIVEPRLYDPSSLFIQHFDDLGVMDKFGTLEVCGDRFAGRFLGPASFRAEQHVC